MTKKRSVRELKEKEEMRLLRLDINRRVKELEKERYYSVSLEVRRRFIELMHTGLKLGDAAKKAGIEDNDVAWAIFKKHYKKKTITFYELNKPEDVK